MLHRVLSGEDIEKSVKYILMQAALRTLKTLHKVLVIRQLYMWHYDIVMCMSGCRRGFYW
jgi:hypothetical protein